MQRYFITAESTYEDLRQALNVQLSYPNALGKTVFQTALQAPRDGFRRVLLAVDTDLQNYAAIAAAILPLTDSDAMEEIDEATYLAAVASAAGSGSSSWDDLSGKPLSFTPSAHKASHATGGPDALTPADIGAAASLHTHSASDITSGTVAAARLGTGTPSASNFLRGDGTWAAAGSSSASDLTTGTLANARLTTRQRASTNLYLWSSFR